MIRPLAILLLSLLPAVAATVTGTAKDPRDVAIPGAQVVFEPVADPTTSGAVIVVGIPITVTTDASGQFSVPLLPGDYRVTINRRAPFTIAVPSGSGTYSAASLATSTLTYTYSPVAGALAIASATDAEITSPTDGQGLIYDGNDGLWKNQAAAGAGTVTSVAVASGGDYITVTGSPVTGAGTITLTPAAILEALADLATAGLLSRTGAGTLAARTITGNAEIVVADGDGVSGNPTLSIASTLARDSELHDAVTVAAGRDYVTISGQELTLGAVDLAADVTGLLPDGNIVATIARDSELHDSVTLAGTPDYLTISGQEITRGAIDLATDTTGTLGEASIDSAIARDSELPTLSDSFSLESPTASDKVPWRRTDVAITITEVVVTLIGTTPSVTVDLRHSTDLSAAGTALITTPSATTNTSTGNEITSFDDATLAANEILWFEADAVSGTVDWITITIKYTED